MSSKSYPPFPDNTHAWVTLTTEILSKSEMHVYLNGVLDDPITGTSTGTDGPADDYSTSEPVRLFVEGVMGTCDPFGSSPVGALLIYRIDDPTAWVANNDRATIEAWLAANL